MAQNVPDSEPHCGLGAVPARSKRNIEEPPWYVVFSVQTGETFSYSVSTRG